MSRPKTFGSWLARHFERFVALKRATGYQYSSQEHLLFIFDRFLQEEVPAPPLEREALSRYLASRPWASRSRDNVISVLWAALSNAQRHGAPIEPLPERPSPAPRSWRIEPPRIVSAAEIERLLVVARQLSSPAPLRPATIATLMGLLYVTGLRIGEALALDVGHLDQQANILTVHRGKFGKSRALPICKTTVTALRDYIEHPSRRMSTGATTPIFVSHRRRRISKPTVSVAFKDVCRRADLDRPWPHPHDLRHSFAVNRVAAWYQEGACFQRLLPALSTYLGHTCMENTRIYLVQNGALLEQASERFARFAATLDEVRS